MKKGITIFFLAIYLLSTTEAHQLLKLPVVFMHFQEHRQENKNLSLLQFLDMHYMHGSPRDKDYDRDMQLPFKTTSCCLSTITTAYVPLQVQYAILAPILDSSKTPSFAKPPFIPSSYLSKIWQPPKYC
ncbi:MAG: hypothetical protein JST58_11505 [Bacteroidetes bacterium]|nr:hypothetical protein [Bacteroidota bacterium]